MFAAEQASLALPRRLAEKRKRADHNPTARQFLEGAVAAALQAFEQKFVAFQQRPGVETVHNLRIAARKLRGTITLIADIAPSATLSHLADHAKGIAKALAGAREADVLQRELHAVAMDGARGVGSAQLAEVLEKHRGECYRQATDALGSISAQEPTVIPLRLNGEENPRRHALQNLDHAGLPARAVATRLLDRLLRRVERKSHGLRKMDDEKRHRLRIAVKNLRYGVELFAPLYAGKEEVPRYLSRLVRFQDDLGICNDAVIARKDVTALLHGHKGVVRRAAGRFLATQDERAGKTLRGLRRRARQLSRSELFWRS